MAPSEFFYQNIFQYFPKANKLRNTWHSSRGIGWSNVLLHYHSIVYLPFRQIKYVAICSIILKGDMYGTHLFYGHTFYPNPSFPQYICPIVGHRDNPGMVCLTSSRRIWPCSQMVARCFKKFQILPFHLRPRNKSYPVG